jgi:acetoin utilization protein AcuB
VNINAGQLITEKILPLTSRDTGIFALSMMEEYKVSHLPIVNDSIYSCLISESDIYALNQLDEKLEDKTLPVTRPFVFENQHILDVLRTFSSLHLSLLPVLDENNKYIGVISIDKLVNHISEIMSIDNPGGIIILEINEKDYLLTEIAQIVESNDAKILNLFITTSLDPGKMEVTLKLNKIDVGPILQTFSRYNYNIKAVYSEDTFKQDLRERYDSLMKFLNV